MDLPLTCNGREWLIVRSRFAMLTNLLQICYVKSTISQMNVFFTFGDVETLNLFRHMTYEVKRARDHEPHRSVPAKS